MTLETGPPVPPLQKDSTTGMRRRSALAMTIVSFIVGLSVLLAYDWRNGGFTPSAPTTIFFGVLVAAVVYIATMFSRQGQAYFFPARSCPICRRIIPADSALCPYCGSRLQ